MVFEFPNIETKRIAFKVSKPAERSIRQNHPWVFENSIIKQNKHGSAGDLAIIFSTKENKMIAIGLYDPHSPIRIKLLSFGKPVSLNQSFFQLKIQDAYHIRRPLLKVTNAFRLIYGENDQLPGLIIDIYNHVAVIKIYSLIWIPYLAFISKALQEIPNITCHVLRLSRKVSQHAEGIVKEGAILWGDLSNETIQIREFDVVFMINVIKGHKTGFFLDHRQNRHAVGQYSEGKSLLDVFCYAGGFSAHGAKSNAKSITSIDISPQAIQLASRNVQLNGGAEIHKTLCGDAFELLRSLIKDSKQYEVIIIDPPSFAKSEKEKNVALNQYSRLAEYAAILAASSGIVVMASCSSRIKLNEFKAANETGFLKSGRTLTMIKETTHDIDHPIRIPEAAYLKCVYYKVEK